MKWVRRLSLLGIVILTPGVLLSFAFNLVVRMPDFYRFELNRNDTERELSLSAGQGELAEVLSHYMWGKTPDLVLEQENENTEQMENVFLPEEQQIMERKRTALNLYSLGMGLAIVALAAAYFVLLRARFKEQLRRVFLLSLPFGALLVLVTSGGLLIGGLPALPSVFFLKPAWPADGIMAAVFTESFVRDMTLASIGVAAVGYLILGMATWNLTEPYHMFRRRKHDHMN